jgi:hypothetical protein
MRGKNSVNKAPISAGARLGKLNTALVNGAGFQFFLTAKCVIFRVFMRKSAIQKVR